MDGQQMDGPRHEMMAYHGRRLFIIISLGAATEVMGTGVEQKSARKTVLFFFFFLPANYLGYYLGEHDFDITYQIAAISTGTETMTISSTPKK